MKGELKAAIYLNYEATMGSARLGSAQRVFSDVQPGESGMEKKPGPDESYKSSSPIPSKA